VALLQRSVALGQEDDPGQPFLTVVEELITKIFFQIDIAD